MANTAYLDVITSFESVIRDREVLADELVAQWFLDALGEFELEVGSLNYDLTTKMFDRQLGIYVVNTLAYLMKIRYLERELSRVNKLTNIRTRDLTQDGMGDTKRATAAELASEISRTKELIHKQKSHWFS